MLNDEQIARAWYGDEYGPGHTIAPGYAVNFARAIEAARATAEQRDSVIEQCAKVCEGGLISPHPFDTGEDEAYNNGIRSCAKHVRALKSQQDAAIKSKPAESRISDAWISVKERLPDFDIPVAVAWDKAPWRTDGESAIDDMLHARNNDSDGWLWYTVATGDLDEWDTEDMPTHWMALPAIESQRSGDGS